MLFTFLNEVVVTFQGILVCHPMYSDAISFNFQKVKARIDKLTKNKESSLLVHPNFHPDLISAAG